VLDTILDQLVSQVVISKIYVDHRTFSGYCIIHDGTAKRQKLESPWRASGKTWKDLSASGLTRCVLVFPGKS
jgi:hypothetical protein